MIIWKDWTMKTTIDMSPQAVTNRMIALDELWELTIALKNSRIIKSAPANDSEEESSQERSQDEG